MAIFGASNPFNKEANSSSVLIGADAPVLEVELNEMQLIQRERLRTTTKALLNEGVKGQGQYTFTNNILTIKDELVMINGELLYIPSSTVSVTEGESVYVETWEEEIDFRDTIKKYGNMKGNETVPNYLLDSRVGEETSRRIQVQHQITTTPSEGRDHLEIGYVEHGQFILLANNLNSKLTPYGNGMDFTIYQHFILVSPQGKKFRLKATYEGELYTEPAPRDSVIGLPLIVTDPTNQSWMIVVDEEGTLSTVTVSKNPLNVHHYLQTPPPFGIIYKIEVTEEGELNSASVCEVNIINDEVTTLDKTWSSYKLNQHVLAQDKVVKDLAAEQTAFLEEVIRQKDELIENLVSEQTRLVETFTREKNDLLELFNTEKNNLLQLVTNEKNNLLEVITNEKNDLIGGLEESSDYIIKYTQEMVNQVLGMHTVINSPNGLVFQLTVDDDGVLGTMQKEVVVKND